MGRRPANTVITQLRDLIVDANRLPVEATLCEMIRETSQVSGPSPDWVMSRKPVDPKVLYAPKTSEGLMQVINHHLAIAQKPQAPINDHVSFFNHRLANMKAYESAVDSSGQLAGQTFREAFAIQSGLSSAAIESIIEGRLVPKSFCDDFLVKAQSWFGGVDPAQYTGVDFPSSNQAIAPIKPDRGLSAVINYMRQNCLV